MRCEHARWRFLRRRPRACVAERVFREVKSARTWPLRKHSLHKNRF